MESIDSKYEFQRSRQASRSAQAALVNRRRAGVWPTAKCRRCPVPPKHKDAKDASMIVVKTSYLPIDDGKSSLDKHNPLTNTLKLVVTQWWIGTSWYQRWSRLPTMKPGVLQRHQLLIKLMGGNGNQITCRKDRGFFWSPLTNQSSFVHQKSKVAGPIQKHHHSAYLSNYCQCHR